MTTILEHISNYLDFCRDIKKLSPASHRAYSFDMMQFVQFLAADFPEVTQIDQISRQILQVHIQKANHRFAASSAKRKIACLKGFFHYLEDVEAIDVNPFDKLRYKVKMGTHIPDVMTLEDLKKILEAAYRRPDREYCNSPVAPPEFIHLRDIAVLETLFATGLRVQELCDLLKEDFIKGQGAVKIVGKGVKERFVYLESEAVLKAIHRYIAMRENIHLDNPYLFINKFGEKLSSQAVRNIVTKYTAAAGIDKNITPHTFRHTFASLLLEEGVDIRYIQEFLGHSSISTTQIYLHVSQKTARNILKSMHPRQKLAQIGDDGGGADRVNNETG